MLRTFFVVACLMLSITHVAAQPTPVTRDETFAAGQEAAARQDYVEAARWWRIGVEKGDPRSARELGRLYANGASGEKGVGKDAQQARDFLGKAAAQGDAEAIKLLGAADTQSPQTTQTRPAPVTAPAPDANALATVVALHKTGQAAIARRDYDEAIRVYTSAINVSGGLERKDRSMLYSNRGFAWNEKRDYSRGMVDFDEAIRIDPQNAWPYFHRSAAWWNRDGNYERAAADLRQTIRLDTKRELDAVNGLAKLEQFNRDRNNSASAASSSAPASQGAYKYEQPDYMKRAEEARKRQNDANCARALKGANVYCGR